MSWGPRTVRRDAEGFVYFVRLTREGRSLGTRGPYSTKGTARGVATQLSRYEYRGATAEVLRSPLGDLEPMLEPQDELVALRAEVAELRFRLASLEK